MTILLALIQKYWKPALLVLAVALTAGFIKLQAHEIDVAKAATITAQQNVARIQTLLDQSQADNANLTAALNKQNAAVLAWQDAASGAQAAAQKAMADAKAKQAASAALIARLQAQASQPNDTTTCNEAIDSWRATGVPDVPGL